MKRNDYILIICILMLTAAVVVWMEISRRGVTSEDAVVVVSIDGQEYGRYPLNQDNITTIELEDASYNVLEIRDGYAEISEASCRDQICVKHFHIHYSGETIVCLPNKLIVEIVGGDEDDIDGATL